jgi:hypothetical protein
LIQENLLENSHKQAIKHYYKRIEDSFMPERIGKSERSVAQAFLEKELSFASKF